MVVSVDEILGRVESLPTLPASVARLGGLVGDGRSSAIDFAEAIRPDAALTANLLRLANSAYFSPSREVTGVQQAVVLIGLRRLLDLANSVAFRAVIPPVLPGYEVEAQSFWSHSVAVAILGERLARELRVACPDLMFTAGLLHDIGKLVLGTFLAGEADRLRLLLLAEGVDLLDAEKTTLGTDHTEIGEAVARRWRLPAAVAAVARWHHHPDRAPPEVQLLVDLAHIADALAHSIGFGEDLAGLARSVEPATVNRLGIRARRLEAVAGAALDEIREIADLFRHAGERGGKG